VDADEREIYHYLKHRRGEFIPAQEIARRIGGRRRYRANPAWAAPLLARMAERGILDRDDTGRCRIKPLPAQATRGRVWAAPGIADLLKVKGTWGTKLMTPEEEDRYYDDL
jgi:hypothetical protein